MRTVTYKVDDLKKVAIHIGRAEENEATRVQIDAGSVFAEYPAAVPAMKVISPAGVTYSREVTRDGDMVVWDVVDSDLAAEGYGEMQMTFTENSVKVKSAIAQIRVCRSISGGTTPPDPVQDWLDEAEAALEAFPTGGTTGQVLAKKSNDDYDTEWVNQGSGGTTDYTELENKPQIGGVTLTGDKSLHDLGAAAESDIPDVSGFYTKPAGGIPASDMAEGVIPDPEDLIDDTAGEGDTDKTWSADKLTSDVLSAIDKLTPDATASDVGKAIIVKTVADGKPTSYEYGEAGGGSVDPSAIAEAVADWCEENITEDPTVVIDTSLLVSGAAADSKAVGERIAPIDEELDWQDTTKNLLAIATKSQGYKLNSAGTKETSSNFDVYEIAYDGSYDTFTATIYSNTNYQMCAISFQNSEGTVLSTLSFPSTSAASTFTNQAIPANTAKILLNNKRSSFTDVVCTCSVKYSKRFKDIEDDIDKNERIFDSLQHITKNLYDVSKATNNCLITPSNGNPAEYTGHIASDFIPVDEKTIYTISAKNKDTFSFETTGLRYAFYNSSKEYISGSSDPALTTFRTPANAAYFRFSLYNTLIEVQFERRHFATKYAPYDSFVVNDESDTMFLNYPSKLYAVTGLQYNFYMFNVTPEQYPGQFMWAFGNNNAKMLSYGRFVRLKDNNTSTSDITCKVDVRSLTKCAEKEFVTKVKNPADLQNVSVLILGDSTTANGYVATDLHGYSGNENKISTLGTCGTAPYNHEGRSGWTLNMYFTSSTNNPFYNPSTQTFDAEYYFSNSGVSVPDIFIINLGINDMHYGSGGLYDAKEKADEYIDKVNAVIESLRRVSATMKIAICLTIPPNVDPYGFGAAGTNMASYDYYRIANLVLCEKLIDEFDYRESEGLYLIPINSVLDTKYNMPTSAQLPNSRASETIMLPDTAGNVHPNGGGYYQIADEIYAFLCWLTAQ